MKRNLHAARALVTGASSGIGRAVAEALARRGVSLVITARRSDALEELAADLRKRDGGRVAVVPGDVTAPETRRALIEMAVRELGGLDFLVNNAGRGATELIEMTEEATARSIMELNFFAPLFLTQEALPELKKAAADRSRVAARGGVAPTVVSLGSIVGLRGTPHFGVYGAAKAAVINLSDALRAELSPDGIGVLTVSPGTTSSEFFDVLWENRSEPNFPKHRAVTPEYVAEKIVAAILAGKHRILPHPESKILALIERLCPEWADALMKRFR